MSDLPSSFRRSPPAVPPQLPIVEVLPGDAPHEVSHDKAGRTMWWFGTLPPAGMPGIPEMLDCIARGSFAQFSAPWAAIVSGIEDEGTWIVSDHLGLQHLFLRPLAGRILAGPDIFAIARLAKTKIDPVAAHQLMSCGNPQSDRTLFSGIHRAKPATILNVSKSTTERTYWVPPCEILQTSQWNETVERFALTVRHSIKRVWSADLYQELTAGVDSFLVLAALLDCDIDFRTWTHAYSDEPDLHGARRRAEFYRVPHTTISKEDLLGYGPDAIRAECVAFLKASNAMADALAYLPLPFVLSRLNAGGSLGGGGGEIFRGFYYGWAGRGRIPWHIGRRILIRGKVCREMPFSRGLWPRATEQQSLAELDTELNESLSMSDSLWAGFDIYYLRSRMRHFAGTTYSATRQWGKVRVPLVDPSILELLGTVPIEWRDKSRLVKAATMHLLGNRGTPTAVARKKSWAGMLQKQLHRGAQLALQRNRQLPERKAAFGRKIYQSYRAGIRKTSSDFLTREIYSRKGFDRLSAQLESDNHLPTTIGPLLTIELAAFELGTAYDGIA